MTEQTLKNEPSVSSGRVKLGITVFVVGFLSPLLIPLVKATQMSAGWKVAISGALAVGVPEVFSLTGIAIMGKAGFNTMKAVIFKWLKRYGPPDRVGLTRYRIGLVMFVLPLFSGWLAPYLQNFIPQYNWQGPIINITGDVIFFSSFFVLGGDFWDKIRSLFLHNAKASLPFQRPDVGGHR